MASPFTGYILFTLSFIAGIWMIVEGCFILLLKKQVTPLPIRILFGLSVLVIGGEKSRQQFAGRTTSKDLRNYAINVLIFGPLIVISSLVYLFTTLL